MMEAWRSCLGAACVPLGPVWFLLSSPVLRAAEEENRSDGHGPLGTSRRHDGLPEPDGRTKKCQILLITSGGGGLKTPFNQ